METTLCHDRLQLPRELYFPSLDTFQESARLFPGRDVIGQEPEIHGRAGELDEPGRKVLWQGSSVEDLEKPARRNKPCPWFGLVMKRRCHFLLDEPKQDGGMRPIFVTSYSELVRQQVERVGDRDLEVTMIFQAERSGVTCYDFRIPQPGAGSQDVDLFAVRLEECDRDVTRLRPLDDSDAMARSPLEELDQRPWSDENVQIYGKNALAEQVGVGRDSHTTDYGVLEALLLQQAEELRKVA